MNHMRMSQTQNMTSLPEYAYEHSLTSDFDSLSFSSLIAQSSYNSPPHPQATPFPNLQPDPSSFHFHSPVTFIRYPNDEAEIVGEEDDDDFISPASMADDGHLEATADQYNSTTAESHGKMVERFKILEKKVNLYRTALEGEWQKAESILDANPSLLTDWITRDKETALHIAAGAKHTAFVEELVVRMTSYDMILKNRHGNTALCFAAASGVVRIAELMVKKNRHLPLILGYGYVTPLFIAVSYKCRHMASYLLSVTDLNLLEPQDQTELLIATIHSDFYDISLKILETNPNLAIMKDTKNNYETALHVLARKPSVIGTRDQPNVWESCFVSCTPHIYNKPLMKNLARALVEFLWQHVVFELPQKEMLKFIRHPTRLLHDAARAGNVEFLVLLIRRYPYIVWEEDDDGKSIFHVAVENRLENVFNLIHEIGGLKDFSAKYRTTVKGKYNILHLAAKLSAPNHLNRVSGAAFQMQRELLWFKEVEKIVLPSQLEAKCDDPFKLTPRQLFTKEHKDLRKDGEEWMKNTANSCMIVSTLIATVVFAAAFTVPGGNDNNVGTPIFQHNIWFTVFVISDAAALVSSSTSILMFLSILTSRYAEDDFLHSLPSRLLFGLASLFISIVCMVVAFSATFFMLYHNANIWVPAMVATMAIVPISCFCALQFKLLVDTFHNTYLSRFLFKSRRRKLFSSSHMRTLPSPFLPSPFLSSPLPMPNSLLSADSDSGQA